MKWNFFQTKKPKPNKPFIFFNNEACLSYGILKKTTESRYYIDHYVDECCEFYEIAKGRSSVAYTLEQIESRNLIQYWAYFSLNGVGEMHVDIQPFASHISYDQSPPTPEEMDELESGTKWEERFKKRLTPNDEYRESND